jgi:hypothetical protein
MSLIPGQQSAFAVVSNLNNATAIDPTQISAAKPSCQDFCSNLIGQANGSSGKAMNGALKNTSGGTGWSTTDDQWCADHGIQTNASVPADGNATTTAVASSSCNINIAPGENCSVANTGVTRCIWYASQAEPQCMAYLTSTDAHDNEIVPIIFDSAAGISCAVACYDQYVPNYTSAAANAACEVIGLAAGVTDLLAVFAQQSSAGARALGALGGVGAGVAAGVSVSQFSDGVTAGTSTTTKKIAVCASAALFILTAIVRGISEKGDSTAKTDACNNVQTLMSKATPVGYTGSPVASGVTTTTTSSGSTLTAATGTTGSSIGNTSASAALNAGVVPQACLDQGISCQASSSAATDAQMLSQSGLDKLTAPLASQIGPAIAAAAESGNLGNAIGSALSTAGLPAEIVKKFTDLANAAADSAPDLNKNINLASGAMSGGGGGNRLPPKSAGSGSDLFGSKAVGAAGEATTSFQAATRSVSSSAANDDIWHTGYRGSIFDIVSEKITSTRDRVSISDWASPANKLRSMLPPNTK